MEDWKASMKMTSHTLCVGQNRGRRWRERRDETIPCVDEDESGFAPDESGSLCFLDTNVSIGSDLVGMLLDFTLVAGLEAERVRVGSVAVVLVGGDCGLLVLLVGLFDILVGRSRRRHVGRPL
jgi:hypothetical protein